MTMSAETLSTETLLSHPPLTSTNSRDFDGAYGRTFMDRLRNRLTGANTDERGFGLLDVLLGMAITVLLLVIGSINLGKVKDRGRVDEAGQQALRMSQALESYVTDAYEAPPRGDGGTPTNPYNHFPNWGSGASATVMTGLGVSLDTDVSIRFYRQLTPTVNGTYTFCSVVTGGGKYAYAYYDSRVDRVLSSGILTAAPTATQCAP